MTNQRYDQLSLRFPPPFFVVVRYLFPSPLLPRRRRFVCNTCKRHHPTRGGVLPPFRDETANR